MKFLSTVFFVVLTIGIPNVHAAWNDEREPLHRCFVTFFGRMYNYSIKMNLLQGVQIEERKFGQELKAKFGYPTTFATYEKFTEGTDSVLDKILEPFLKHSFTHDDKIFVTDIVRSFAACINNNPNLTKYQGIPLFVRTQMQSDGRTGFQSDANSTKDPLTEAGTSSAPQGMAPPKDKWVINDDYGYLAVCAKVTSQGINESNWWLYDLQNL